MIEMEDLEQIKDYFDDRYVKQQDCNDKHEEMDSRFANDDKRIEIISHDFSIIKKLVWAVASATIGQLILQFFDILKGI